MDKVNKQAILVLHEIYGINGFIEETCRKFQNAGFDVFCPNLIGRPAFPYEESEKAYLYFVKKVGFDISKEISSTVDRLKEKYEKVFIVGFSIGATIAWKCCENPLCDGIVGCYGSRIRDYVNLSPACPTLLLFAGNDSFAVDSLIAQLQGKPYLLSIEFNASHGFMDSFSQSFEEQAAKCAEDQIFGFLSEHG